MAYPPSTPRDLLSSLEARAREMGFQAIGVAEPGPSGHIDTYREWVASGRHGDMEYLARPESIARRAEPGAPSASGASDGFEVRSLLVVAHPYGAADPEGVPDDPGVGVIARYARGRDYHNVLRKRLERLLDWLDGEARRQGVAASVRGSVHVDAGPVLERELAQRAGIGWFGRNTMLIDPTRGSYFLLGVVAVDLELPRSQPFEADRCGTCSACLPACPTGALEGRDETGAPILDARKCISYWTIETDAPIPLEIRSAMGNRIFGCDICQECCPWNRFAYAEGDPAYAARGPGERPSGVEADPTFPDVGHPGTGSPALIDLMEMSLDSTAWDSFSRGSPLRRAGRAGFARNVAVALGNWGSPEAVPVLRSALSDPEPLVRGHASWALGCVASPEARTALESASASEEDPFVSDELESALRRSRARGSE